MAKNLTAYRGDSKVIDLTFKDGDGVAIDISLWTIFFTVKESKDDLDADAVIAKNVTTHSDPTHGISEIALVPADTEDLAGNYFYDIQIKKGDGTIATVIDGLITFKEDVTIRVAV